MSDSTAPTNPSSPLTAPFGAIEPNVVIAGLETAVAIWATRAALLGEPLIPTIEQEWRWSYAIVGFAALLAIVLLGLALEGIAGALEYPATYQLSGKDKGKLRRWYAEATDHPERLEWLAAQRWIWTSQQASNEFSRRRTRILVSRNTTCVSLLLTIALAVVISDWTLWLLVDLLAGGAAVLVFGWVWVRANWAYHRAVHDASALGPL